MDDDWQEAAFSSRHMHNRVARNGPRRGHNSSFDVRKTFGTYDVKCAAWKRVATDSNAIARRLPKLELYRLSKDGAGILGELSLPDVLQASVILAGSKKILRRIVLQLETGMEENTDVPSGPTKNDDSDDSTQSKEEPSQLIDSNIAPEEARYQTFEKNSFRSPKFWFQWQDNELDPGVMISTTKQSTASGLGYIVFAGNDCGKFRGTINCESLEWKDVAIKGWKTISKTERDVQVRWFEPEISDIGKD